MANTQAQTGLDIPFMRCELLRSLAENWWLLLLRGVAAIIFGILAFVWPGITLVSLTLLWGVYAFADGIFALWAAISGKGAAETSTRWWVAGSGIVSVLAGFVALFWPGMTTLVLLMFIASWAIIIGALQIWGAIELRKEVQGEWLFAMYGVLWIAFGVVMFAQPGAGALALVWMIGWFAILSGCMSIALAFRLRTYKRPA
jgi:uncharacterized membrane protein HdeD (DUF308 family)